MSPNGVSSGSPSPPTPPLPFVCRRADSPQVASTLPLLGLAFRRARFQQRTQQGFNLSMNGA
jgi:hypothetical protein